MVIIIIIEGRQWRLLEKAHRIPVPCLTTPLVICAVGAQYGARRRGEESLGVVHSQPHEVGISGRAMQLEERQTN